MTIKEMEWTKEQIKAFWDYQSQFKENYFTHRYEKSLLDVIGEECAQGGKILDFAAGAGTIIEKLLSRGFQVAATDTSPDSVNSINRKYTGREGFIGAYVSDDDEYKDEKYDFILFFEIIEHLRRKEIAGILSELRQHLKPGGKIFITTPNNEDLEVEKVFCPHCSHTFHRWQHLQSFDTESLKACLVDNGLCPSKIVTTDFSLANLGTLQTCVMRLRYFLGVRKYPHLYALATPA